MIYLYKKKSMHSETGQSLTEFIIITPIFFIILSGIISIFHLQIRHYIDFESSVSLSLSPYLFEQEERVAAHWDNTESNNTLRSILNKALNPSLGFSTTSQNTVFKDKIFVKENASLKCSVANTYTFQQKNPGQYQMSTCSNKNGYENSTYSFQKVLNGFPLSFFKMKGTSIYFPQEEYHWENRSSMLAQASREFLISSQGLLYAKNEASLSFPNDSSDFNKKIFMEPFSPQKSLRPYSEKFNSAAQNGANIQLAKCFIEMTARCAAAAVAAPECEILSAADLFVSSATGNPAQVCPIVNKEIEAGFKILKWVSLGASVQNLGKEGGMRKNFY